MLWLNILVLSVLLISQQCDAASPGYCTRSKGIFNTTDGANACFNDNVAAGLINCCFRCVRDATITACGSFFNYGVTSCTGNSTATAMAIADCNGTAYQCTCFTGSDTTELYSTATASPTLSPVAGPNTVNTNSPTNSASSMEVAMLVAGLSLFTSLLSILS